MLNKFVFLSLFLFGCDMFFSNTPPKDRPMNITIMSNTNGDFEAPKIICYAKKDCPMNYTCKRGQHIGFCILNSSN